MPGGVQMLVGAGQSKRREVGMGPRSQEEGTCCAHPFEHVTQKMEKDPPLTQGNDTQVRALWAFLHVVFFILCKDTVFLFP